MAESRAPRDLTEPEHRLADLLTGALERAFPGKEIVVLAEDDAPEAAAQNSRDGMLTETEIRERGYAIDVPFEACSADPQPLRYSNGKTLMEMFPTLMED